MLDYDKRLVMGDEMYKSINPSTYLTYYYPQWHTEMKYYQESRGYRFKQIDEPYILDTLAQEFPNWLPGDSVFIEAPTGSGKNTFIEEGVIKAVNHINIMQELHTHKYPKKRILIISNRVALSRQIKKRIYQLYGQEEELSYFTEKGIDMKCRNVEIVWMYSYQQLEKMLEKEMYDRYNTGIFGKKYDYVICDEAHFFLRDANFNPFTDMLLDRIIEQFSEGIRIYMTATPEGIFPEIIKREEESRRTPVITAMDYLAITKDVDAYLSNKRIPLIWGYQKNIRKGFDYEFSEKLDKQLISLIEENKKSEKKTIIWVKSRKQGEEFEARINDIYGKETGVLLTADSKESKEYDGDIYDQIINREKFLCDVLISTIVLENGVNIKDEEISLQLCFLDDYFSIVQCLGRVRNPNPEMKIIFKEYTTNYLENVLRRSEERIDAMNLYEKNPQIFYDYFLKNNYKNFGLGNATKMLHSGKIHLNKLAITYEEFQCSMIRRILESKESRPYAREVLHWFSMSLVEKQIEDSLDVIEWGQALENYEGSSIIGDQKVKFREEMTAFSKRAFGRRTKDKVEDGVYGIKILNEQIEKAKLKFVILSDKKTAEWTVYRKDNVDGQ